MTLSLGRFSVLLIEPYKDVSEERPQDVGRKCPLELQIRPYGDVLVTSAGDLLKTSAGDVPWHYIEDHMGTSFVGVIRT